MNLFPVVLRITGGNRLIPASDTHPCPMKVPSMKSASHSLVIPAMAVMLQSCAPSVTVHDGNEQWRAWRGRNRIVPEGEWNAEHVWRRLSNNPAVYVPAAYPSDQPRSASDGEWVEDERDGKRFFVPNSGVPGMSGSVLKNDALKNSRPFRATPDVY